MKKRWMVQAFALALTGVLVFGTGTVTYADEKKPVVIGEMVGQDTSDKDNAKNTKEGKDASGKECDQCQDPVYTWTPTDSGYTCKAVRECKDPENGKKHYREETAKVEAKTTKQATCEEEGEIVYTATFENKTETDKKDDAKAEDTKKADAKAAESGLFKTQTRAVKINALGHKYGEVTYTWNQTDNGYTCTASRVCENDSSHGETETVEASMEVTKAPTCEEEGEEVYTAVFTNEAFETQTQTVKTGALGHHFGDVSYEWTKTDKGYTCTASAVCDVDSYTATETVEAAAEVTKAPTCEEKGEETYTAVFTNPAFETQTQMVEIGALGHLYGEASYKWTKTDKGYTCTATRICQNDNTHVDKEAVAAAVEVAKAATCEEKGEETYTAVFTNKAFKTQTKTVETDALGHLYGEVSYKWTKEDKGYSCTASRVCENDKNHVEKETVTAAYKVITKATSDKAGEGLYTAAFKNAAFEEQSKKVKLVAADKKDNTKKKTTTKKNTANKTTTKKTAAKTTAKKSTAVKTGDENKPVVMGIVAIGALAVIVVAGRQLRKKHE
ncbi:hypothetical protein [Coprococcus catus]|uniref:hypothetical protein n=1 Tax=Coprococcus catus TaxID=116085 RepID=UPI001C8B3553|nr:hypothetical protein [Coprococcus catus]MBX9229635.1 hypothetical protein [Coprococcus catus]MCT6801689.1 hypothetical protein [Coprococcus catus]